MKSAFVAILIVFCFQISFAQQLGPSVIATAGHDHSNGDKRVSYTIGELVVPTFKTTNYFLTQGFQQPVKFMLSGINKDPLSEVSVKIFPNPTTKYVNIKVSNATLPVDCQVEVYNMFGQKIRPSILRNKINNGENIKIDLSGFTRGTYFIRILDKEIQKRYTDFKVIKIE